MDAAAPETTTNAPTEAHSDIALWNPNAAALWSVIFTPLFGAYLHALNWRALGDKEREEASMTWVFGAGALVLLKILIEVVTPPGYSQGDKISHLLEYAFLLAWYVTSGRTQARFVKEKFGKSFTHKSWRKPLLMGLAGFGIYTLLMIAIAAEIGIRSFL